MQAVARHHHVGGALVLDLEHRACVRLVRRTQRLRDHPVEAGALELLEPALCLAGVRGRAGEVDRTGEPTQLFLEARPAGRERLTEQGLVTEGEGVEHHVGGGRLLGEHVDP